MDTAEMIDERKLRQGFVLATLISTVAGTFITGINLYDRLIEQRRQKKLDRGQNKRIKELEQRLNEAENEKKQMKEAGKKNNDKDGENDFRNSLQQSGNMVQSEYNRYLSSLGPRFAQGDLIAQNQIQSQIILLQGSVIKLLEEAILTGTIPDINRLYNTSEFAREGSIRALRDQYQRLLQQAPPQQRRPVGPMRKISSTPSLRDPYADSAWNRRGSGLAREPPPRQMQERDDPLFCRSAEHLQRTNKPLDSCLAIDRSAAVCDACGSPVCGADEVDGGRAWRIEKEVVMRGSGSVVEDRRYSRGSDAGSESVVVRTFLLSRRFVFKCHREGEGYACYLCFCNRDRDTLCRSEEGLVEHVTSKHRISEYEGDGDIREMGQLPYR